MSTTEPPAPPADPSAPAPEAGPPDRPRHGATHRALPWLGLLALLLSAAAGGNLFGLGDRLTGSEPRKPRAPAASRAAGGSTPAATVPRPATLVRSQPWWQAVTTLEGQGTTTSRLSIEGSALQWRVRGECGSGRLVVTVPSRPKPLLSTPCAGAGTGTPFGYATKTGAMSLKVAAAGPWKLRVEQQVDVPLVEDPLPAMSAPGTKVLATGDFYRMDQTGQGTVTLYRLADGSHALRLDDFFVSPNIDLQLTFSPLEAPHTTPEFVASPWVKAAPLDITAGALNFDVPREIDPSKYRSVVIWCPLIDSAYAAATLHRV
ncbi:MAG TPA: DM13 domain-containing protein [Acidimicrobiales bacterium]|nr:DM13 domain-containing protein [Acidimicrobiales bacterium]